MPCLRSPARANRTWRFGRCSFCCPPVLVFLFCHLHWLQARLYNAYKRSWESQDPSRQLRAVLLTCHLYGAGVKKTLCVLVPLCHSLLLYRFLWLQSGAKINSTVKIWPTCPIYCSRNNHQAALPMLEHYQSCSVNKTTLKFCDL